MNRVDLRMPTSSFTHRRRWVWWGVCLLVGAVLGAGWGAGLAAQASDQPDDEVDDVEVGRATFAPFLDIVPSEDGTELLISAGGTGQVGGMLFANIDVGPGHAKGSYTMPYSPTLQAYVTSAPGFTPGRDTSAPLSITSTLGLDTGVVEFVRAYVPGEGLKTILSADGALRLAVVSTDTFPSAAYVTVTPSYAPPGPPPLGHRLVSSTYSVRASGAVLAAERPVGLEVSYEPALLGTASPHTLALFAWDPFSKRWNNLGGTLFAAQRTVSVVTSRFTAYAIMATTTWTDGFDDITGLDLAQSEGITFVESESDWMLALAPDQVSGVAVSQPVTPPTRISAWGTLYYSATTTTPTTTLTIDLLAKDGTLLLADVSSGMTLSTHIDAEAVTSLRLRARFSSTVAGQSAGLESWQITWEAAVEPQQIFLPSIALGTPAAVAADRPRGQR